MTAVTQLATRPRFAGVAALVLGVFAALVALPPIGVRSPVGPAVLAVVALAAGSAGTRSRSR